ncbi:acyl-CoA synthetase [Allostella vacuolata]|nr:acyl-CoA synthetase [Stella vacuolata]
MANATQTTSCRGPKAQPGKYDRRGRARSLIAPPNALPAMSIDPQSWYGEAIVRNAARHPDRPAIVSASHTVSFRGFQRSIEQIATSMLAHGCRPGEPVALGLGRQPIDLVLLFAAHRLGVPVLVIGNDEPPDLTRPMIAAAGAARVLSTAAAPPPRRLGVPAFRIDESWLRVAVRGLPPPPGPRDVCYLLRSSGTTQGVPKLVEMTHAGQSARHAGTQTRLVLGPADRFLAIFSFHLGYGRGAAQRSLMSGGGVVIPPPLQSPAHMAELVRQLGATWAALTPAYLLGLMAADWGPGRLLPGLRIVVGTGTLSPAARRAAMARLSSEIHVMYGVNEVGVLTLATPDELRANPETAGRPDPQTELRVVDEHDRPLPPGAIGIVRFRHALYPSGYLRATPDATSRFEGGWFYPGDVGLIDASGQLFLKGRVDDLINVSGAKVYPADIENCLSLHPAVSEVAVVAVPHPHTGTLPVACVVLGQPATLGELARFCQRRLGAERSPRRIVVMPDLPKTELGKFDRRALRERLRD